MFDRSGEQMTLKPWRDVILPHEDVLEGKFDESEFAADLTKVVRGIAKPEYQDPVRFFERTMITEGMSLLLQSVVKRLAGKGGEPVVQLQTAFGGGKTHTMMAVMHVACGSVPAKSMLGVAELLDKAKVKELVRARVVVLDGNALAPAQPQEHGKVAAHTLWGELAWQLGGDDGYAMVADSDHSGTSPGKDVLARLLEKYAPAVILLDETVAYMRQLEPGRSYKGGTFNSNLSFLQALTEAVSRVPNAMLLASLPESAMEVGDAQGQAALDACQKIFGRIEAVWKPVGTDEAFEIVRRRLFKNVQSDIPSHLVCRAFADLYAENSDKFPAETRDAAYLRRLKASYPIHPEVFERLYEDWSTLPKFQRTRGVLRLMARLVHSLWRSDNRDYLILPGSIPLDDHSVRNELIKYLPSGWDPVIDKDIDGTHAEPRQIDDEISTLGSIQACRRVARAIFLGSAPSVGTQKVRGVGVERVRLGCVQPGQSPGKYDDALKRLSDRLHNLYSGNERFWFDLRANLRREMEDRLQRFDLKLHVYPEIRDRLQKLVKSSTVQHVHVFTGSKDVPDKPDLRLVVLDPDHGHKRKDENSKAVIGAAAILKNHGDKPREYQNRLIFLVPDINAVQPLRDSVQRYLAWQSIVEDKDEINLDTHQRKEVAKSMSDAADRVEGSLREAYRILLAPMAEPDDVGNIVWEDEALGVAGSSYDKAIASTTREREWVISAWAPTHLAVLLAKWFWKDDKPDVGAKKVWLDTCRYLYLPRLATEDVFASTVRDGIKRREWFGYAASAKDGGYQGVVLGSASSIYLDDSSLLLHPEAARAAMVKPTSGDGDEIIDPDFKLTGEEEPPTTGTIITCGGGGSPSLKYRRFHATVDVESTDPIGSFTNIFESVIQHFTSQYGTRVTLTLDIAADLPIGFDDRTIRVVKENAATLKFKIAEFETE
jgi:predicted AAA+ superfamily ATPase